MERAYIALLGLILPSLLDAQEIRVEYDKLSGAVTYSKCVQKRGRTECRTIDRPFLKKGGSVELKVTNINEFVYEAKTSASIDQDTLAMHSFGSSLRQFVGTASSIFGSLSFGGVDLGAMQYGLGGSFNMGGADAGLIPDELKRELLPLQARERDVEEGLDKLLSEVRAVDGTLADLQNLRSSRDKTLAQIRKEKDSLLTSLAAGVPGVMEPGYARRTERNLADQVALARRIVNEQQGLLASLNNEVIIASGRRSAEDLDAMMRGFDGSSFDKRIGSIRSISADLDKATFEYAETIVIDKDDVTGLHVSVEIFDQTEVVDPADADAIRPGMMVRYFPDRWIDPQGQLTDTMCTGCRPLKESEGAYHGSPQLMGYGSIAGGDVPGQSGAYGLWKRWDRNGMLVEEYLIDRPDLAGMVNPAAVAGPVHKLDERRAFVIPVHRGLVLGTSVGLSFTTLLEAPKEYQVIPDSLFGYSILLENARSNVIPVLSSFFHFHWDGPGSVHLGGNLGLGLALAERSSLNVMGGPSLICGRKQTLSVNMGMMATQVDRKLDYLPVGRAFDSNLAANGTTTKQWDLGLFIGVSVGIGQPGRR